MIASPCRFSPIRRFRVGSSPASNAGFRTMPCSVRCRVWPWRDATIFPNFGGRFFFSREDCITLAEGAGTPMGSIRPIFPVPAGGMSVAQVQELARAYGSELIILVGGGLFRSGPDLVENCRVLLHIARQFPAVAEADRVGNE